MKIITQQPNPSGAYPPIQEGSFSAVPEGMAVWPEELDTGTFYQYNGFVTLTIKPVKKIPVVTGVQPNVEAWEKWKAEQPEPGPEPEPADPQADTDAMLVDHELRITLLELGVTE